MPTQACPNCQKAHDVGIYVTGQKVTCSCGIRFDVQRTDVSGRTLNLRRTPQRPSALNTARPGPSSVDDGGVEISLSGIGLSELSSKLPPPVNGSVKNAVESGVDRTFISNSQIDIPGYDLVQLLGRGGMGEVWRAHQRSLGRTVAVKLLPQELAKDPEFVTRFEKEATALASLSHPHIIQIIDRGSAGPHYYFVMEFVEGRSLREVMAERRLTVAESIKVVVQILRAIECAHEKEIIHRDLKPENILVDGRGHIKVADFGLAGIRGADERLQLTGTAVAMGTINYMAPEQRRDARNVDARADLYSLGVIIYELLTGELPIGRFRMPSEKIPGLDGRLDEIVGRLLESDPSHRFPSATDVLVAIEPMAGSGIATPLPSSQAPVGGTRAAATALVHENRSVVERGFRGLRNGLVVIGALAVVGFGARFIFGEQDIPKVTISGGGKELTFSPNGVEGKTGNQGSGPARPAASGNSYGEVFSAVEESGEGATSELALSFGPGDEEINVHAGEWTLSDGKLRALQAGSVPAEGKALIPRAYVAHRYFSSDHFEAEVELSYRDIRDRFDVADDVQRFAELSFRITGTQVSAFAIPGVGMRLGWRYFTPDGVEVSGNSARDLELMIEDEMPAPSDGKKFRMKLVLKKKKDAVDVTAYLNDRAFAHKVLPGLQGQVGKIALGCRNYECTFENLSVRGAQAERPRRRVAESAP